MATKRGGQAHAFPNDVAYKNHLREMARQGKSNNESGDWIRAKDDSMLIKGYNFDKKKHRHKGKKGEE